jgi:FkbM family methyltransferase
MRFLFKSLFLRLGLFARIRSAEVYLRSLFGLVHDREYFLLPAGINGSLILDVGANLGQSITSLHKIFPQSRIVSFEPNPSCQPMLNRVALGVGISVDLHFVGVGDTNSEMDFYVPVLADGDELLQEGSFDSSVFSDFVTKQRIGDKFELRTMKIPVKQIDEFSLSPSLIKVDVQGYELQVLRGAIETIRRSRPVLFLERDVRSEAALECFLRDFNYEKRLLGCNVMFIPKKYL